MFLDDENDDYSNIDAFIDELDEAKGKAISNGPSMIKLMKGNGIELIGMEIFDYVDNKYII